MSRTLYSAEIFAGHNLGSPVDVYLDPGFVWVLRDVDIFFPGPDVGATFSLVDAITGGTFIHFSDTPVSVDGVSHQWQGRQVLIPLEGSPVLTIITTNSLHQPDVRMSGYKLLP